MTTSHRAPKQWMLASDSTVTQYESWKNNLIYTISLDPLYAPFLCTGIAWLKQSRATPNRGFTDDPNTVAEPNRKTAAQKVIALELMLGQIANFSPINRGTIVKSSTSLKFI